LYTNKIVRPPCRVAAQESLRIKTCQLNEKTRKNIVKKFGAIKTSSFLTLTNTIKLKTTITLDEVMTFLGRFGGGVESLLAGSHPAARAPWRACSQAT